MVVVVVVVVVVLVIDSIIIFMLLLCIGRIEETKIDYILLPITHGHSFLPLPPPLSPLPFPNSSQWKQFEKKMII